MVGLLIAALLVLALAAFVNSLRANERVAELEKSVAELRRLLLAHAAMQREASMARQPAPPITPPPPPRPEPRAAEEPRGTRGTTEPRGTRGTTEPPRPSTPPPPPPPRAPIAPPKPPFDWESLIGVRLFSWIAGIALVLAMIFLLKYGVEHGLLRPAVRAAIGLASGIALLIVCELRIARGYAFTANAMHGAGIAILYATLFALHGRWHLWPAWAAFLGMLIVTAAAVFLSVRRDSVFIALLGLLGGFATPALLSSGENRPIALFSYLLLLNGGMSWIAFRKRWPLLTALSVLLTVVYQWSWVAKFLDTGQLPLAATIFVLFAIVAAASLGARAERPFERIATIGAALPLLFAFFTAIVPEYGARYHVLFGFLLLVTSGLAAIALWRGPAWLHTIGGGATAVTFFIWLTASYTPAAWPEVLLWLAAFVVLYLAAGMRLKTVAVQTAGVLFFVLIGVASYEEPGYALQLGTMFALLALVATYAIRYENAIVFAVAAVLSAGTILAADEAPPALRLASMLGVAAMAVGAVALRVRFADAAFTVLFAGSISTTIIGAADLPSFAALTSTHALLLAGILGVAWVTERHAAVVWSLLLAALALVANDPSSPGEQLLFAFVLYALYILYALLLGARVKESLLPHLAAALASALFFFPAYDALEMLGFEDVIGLLPLALAAVMVLLLWRLMNVASARRTRLAIVAGTALAFITLAVPLQLEKEWITISWALEAAALAWLFRRIEHQGLLIWSGGLAAAVFIRLVCNPSVFDYHPRAATPIVNWYLYTYAVSAAALFLAAWLFPKTRKEAAGAIAGAATLILFVLLNIEIADFYSTGSALTFNFLSSSLAQDLTYTIGWALFAIAVLVAGIALQARPARVAALVLLVATILKCFLHDLGRLGGLYRVGSLFGLAVSLVLVGILLQKFVMSRQRAEPDAG